MTSLFQPRIDLQSPNRTGCSRYLGSHHGDSPCDGEASQDIFWDPTSPTQANAGKQHNSALSSLSPHALLFTLMTIWWSSGNYTINATVTVLFPYGWFTSNYKTSFSSGEKSTTSGNSQALLTVCTLYGIDSYILNDIKQHFFLHNYSLCSHYTLHIYSDILRALQHDWVSIFTLYVVIFTVMHGPSKLVISLQECLMYQPEYFQKPLCHDVTFGSCLSWVVV